MFLPLPVLNVGVVSVEGGSEREDIGGGSEERDFARSSRAFLPIQPLETMFQPTSVLQHLGPYEPKSSLLISSECPRSTHLQLVFQQQKV